MGKLVDGRWTTRLWSRSASGAFERSASVFREAITADGPFRPESGRYHLYVSYACPWAHRTLIARSLLGLEPHVGVTVVDPFMTDEGWHFSTRDGCDLDPHLGARFLRDVYLAADPRLTSRVTVPVLWDLKTGRIVSNESAEIVRMFDRALAPALVGGTTLTPLALQEEVDALTRRFYNRVNNGVYRCGFATSQGAYERAFAELFDELDRLDRELEGKHWLVGDQLTDADIFLFTTLLRFDPVYYLHFKCNGRHITEYANLQGLLERMLAMPEVASTVRMDHIHEHYHRSHESLNPHRILPRGPLDHLSHPMLTAHPTPVPGDAEPPRAVADTTLLDDDAIRAKLAEVPEWSRDGDHLVRELSFPDFAQAYAFVQHVAARAEVLNHHPDIELGWGRVKLAVTTHDSGGLTDLDFALARAIDAA
ncbi:MAG: 4a-hydroxytetrahydrobiopterin dehydratase [Deltaproteobacteria bacterium]|nr:MAG: 4a-hydroxytetrahydrobiopterin dehydratase [Deltaproteobacteria bacterium]